MKKSCKGSGHIVENVEKESFKAVCPFCKREIKARFSSGGYEGYAKYWYLSNHSDKRC